MSDDDLDNKAYIAMHGLRLDYAIGKFNNDRQTIKKLKAVLPKLHGKEFYKTLDQEQIDELAVGLALGIFEPKQVQSIKTKFPDVRWGLFTEKTFFVAAMEYLAEDPDARAMLRCENPDWKVIQKWRFADLAVGRYLKERLTFND